MTEKHRRYKYWKDISKAVESLSDGLKLTFKHLKDALYKHDNRSISEQGYFDQDRGRVTLQYPKEKLPVPETARYRLHNEEEDCIVCDKCAKICPVDCIDIVGILAGKELHKASDGSSVKIHLAKFDIDMAKCMFCGLCTTVCPTECLTMTPDYDYSVYDFKDLNEGFATMTPVEILRAEQDLEARKQKKIAEKAKSTTSSKTTVRPSVQIKAGQAIDPKDDSQSKQTVSRPKIQVKPKVSVQPKSEEKPVEEVGSNKVNQVRPKIQVKPKISVKPKSEEKPVEKVGSNKVNQVRPKIQVKPKVSVKPKSEEKPVEEVGSNKVKQVRPKIQVKPKVSVKPKSEEKPVEEVGSNKVKQVKPKIQVKPRFQLSQSLRKNLWRKLGLIKSNKLNQKFR